MITGNNIREREFSCEQQGYSQNEVDDFLDALAEQLDALVRQMDALRQENDALKRKAPGAAPAGAEGQAAPVDEPAYFKNLEATLRETLISAQRIADETVAKAKAEAQEKVSGAEEQAEAILSSARAEADTARAEADTMRRGIEEYRARFRQLVEEQANILKGVSFFED